MAPYPRDVPSDPAAAPRPDWPGVRLHVVTGKGGTGKTVVAAALAIALAHAGGRVLLMEVEGRQGLAQLFDTPPLPYAETRLARVPGGGEVFGLAVDPEAALLEYLEMFYNARRMGSVLKKLGAIDFATTIAPGIRDVLLTGKAKEAVRRKRAGRHVYDAVVMDAPPTGRITHFLNVNTEVAGLAKVGPIRNQADAVMAVVASPLTAVHLVTLLEPMPVQETIDGVGELTAAWLPVGAVIVNMVRRPRLDEEELRQAVAGLLPAGPVRAGLEYAGLTGPDGLLAATSTRTAADVLVAEGGEHARRVVMEQEQRAALAQLARPTYELPWLADGVDLGALFELAGTLRDQGAA